MRTSPWWLTSTSYLVCTGRSCFSGPQIPANNALFLVELLSSRRRWIKYVFNEAIWHMSHNVGQGGRVSQSVQSSGTLYRLFCGTALSSTCWAENSFRITLKMKQKQNSSFQNWIDLHTVILVQITSMTKFIIWYQNQKKSLFTKVLSFTWIFYFAWYMQTSILES